MWIAAKVWDATVRDEGAVAAADLVIADLPCSGLGVLHSKPDIKYNMSPEQMQELAELQREILTVVADYVLDDKWGDQYDIVSIYTDITFNKNDDNSKKKY